MQPNIKYVISEMFFAANLSTITEKLNQSQQKQTSIHNKIQNKK